MNRPNPSVCKKLSSPSLSNTSEGNPEGDLLSDTSVVCTNCQGDELPQKRRLWYNELRILKELGLDRVALAASNACKRCLKEERNDLDNEPELADSVPQSYEELKADLKAFQERVKNRKPKFAYKDPGKYQHLMQ